MATGVMGSKGGETLCHERQVATMSWTYLKELLFDSKRYEFYEWYKDTLELSLRSPVE